METIKTIRKEIANLLTADNEVTTTLQTHVYNARQLPGTFNNEVCVFSQGAAPSAASLGGGTTPYYQYGILWLIKFGTGGLVAAEDVSDDLEQAIYRVLFFENQSHSYWRKVTFPQLSLRPLAPGGTQNSTFGRIVVRISPRA